MEIPKKKELFELEHICPSTKRKFHQDAGPPNWKCLCINFQPGGPESQCIYSIPKRLAYDQTDRHNSQMVLGTGDLGRSEERRLFPI